MPFALLGLGRQRARRLKAVNLGRGRQEGAVQKQLATGSLEGVREGGRQGTQVKKTDIAGGAACSTPPPPPTPNHTREGTSHVL